MNFKNISILALVLFLLSVFSRPVGALAQYYSPGESKQVIVVDKKLRSTTSNDFFDNLSTSQKVFVDSNGIEFRVVIQNNGEQDLNNISVVDTLPKYLNLIFFPGTYNKSSNTISWTVDKLTTGQSREYFIRALISGVDNSTISFNTKLVNRVTACVTKICDNDYSSYFVNRRVTPTTGNDSIFIKTVGILTLISSGFVLRKIARGY